MKAINKEMKEFLSKNGIEAVPKYIESGSLKGTWRIYSKGEKIMDGSNLLFWTKELAQKMTSLGFRSFDGKPLSVYSGNGGRFSVFVIK